MGFPWWLSGKNLPANAGDLGSVPGSEDLLEKEMSPVPVFLPEKSMDRRAWRTVVHGFAKESEMT